jgi:hypothetical protein
MDHADLVVGVQPVGGAAGVDERPVLRRLESIGRLYCLETSSIDVAIAVAAEQAAKRNGRKAG